MDAIECLKTRRSVRTFLDKEIPEDILKEIIDCARLAPTARNEQPWEFIVIKDKEMLAKIAEATTHGKFIKDAAACIIVVCKDADYYLEDGCAATENILLAARSFDIGTCWIAGDKKGYTKEIAKFLDIPEEYNVVSIMPLGYADSFPAPNNKREVEDVLHWEKF